MGYKVTFGSGQSVTFDNEPSQEDIEEAEASLGLTSPVEEASWAETLKGAGATLLNRMGSGLTNAAVGLEQFRGEAPTNKLLASFGVEAAKPNTELIDKLYEFDKNARIPDAAKGKQLSTSQRFAGAGAQIAGAVAGGPAAIASMMAGGTSEEVERMLQEGMPVEKAQQYGAADAALNVGSVALGGVGKRPITQAVTMGAGNVAADEGAHLLANKFREDEGLKLNERDNVDRGISFAMGAVPGYLAQRTATDVEATRKPTTDPDAEAKAAIDAELAKQEANDPLNKPSTLELLDKEAYPEPLGNRTIDPDTKTVTTGMAEDVPTIDFPLRPEAMERDRKFQKLQRDLLTERQILEDYQTRQIDEASIREQEAAVEAARQKMGDYLDQAYGAKTASDLYGRSIYESGQPPALAIERGFDRSNTPDGGMSLVPKEGEARTPNDRIIQTNRPDLGKPESTPVRDTPTFEKSKEIALKISKESAELNLLDAGTTPRTKADFSTKTETSALDFSNKLRDRVQAGDYKGALEHIARSKPNTLEGKIAGLLAKLNDDTVTLSEKRNMVSEEADGSIRSVGGAYLPTSHSIMLSHLTSGDFKTFIHEAVHSATSNVISRVMEGNTTGLGFREKWAASRLLETYEQAKKLSKNPNLYGWKNPKEFLSEVMSSNQFRNELKSIELPGSKWSTMYHKVVDEVRQILGLPDKPNYNNALERAIHHGANVIEHSQKKTREAEVGKKGDNTLKYQDNNQRSVWSYFEPSLFKDTKPGWKSRYLLRMMNIDDFLNLSSKVESGDVKSEAAQSASQGTKWGSVPFLYFSQKGKDAVVNGHEGRNRALHLKSQGFTEMPVEWRGDIRWSEQNDPSKFDFKTEWPTKLKAQSDAANPNFSIDFPRQNTDFNKGIETDFAPPNKLDRFATFEQFRDSLPENLRPSAGKYWTENGRELPKSEVSVARNEAQNKAADALIGGDPRAHFLTQDLRSAEEIRGVLEGYKDANGKYKDINSNAARNALASGGFAISNLVQHPLVHWVTSKTMKAVKQAEIKSETAISETGKGFLAIFKGATPEMQKVLSAKMLAAEGKDVKLEFTPWEQRVADSWNKAKEQALKDFNEARVAKGLEPVEPRLNYLASMFRGNFRMLVQKDGKTVGWINGNSKVELERAKAFFAKDGYEFGNTSRIPYARSKDFQKTIARKMAAFDEVVNILGASDPEVKLFADRMENMISKQAYDYLDFKQHFKEKSGVFGAEGMKAWEDAHRNAIDLWNAQAEYIRMTNQWVAQQSVEADVRAVLSDPKTVNNFPNAHTLARQVYDNAFGRTENRLEILEAIADGYVAAVNADFITNTPGLRNLQKVNPFEAMRGIKNWALYSALAWNPGFVFSQFLQVPAATATMMKYMEEVGLQGNAAMATLWGTSDSVNSHPYMKKFAEQYAKMNGEKLPDGFQTELGSYFNKYAEENHIIQPHILEKTDIYSANPTVKKIQQADEMMGKSISWAEEKTRRQAFMTLAHYLASSGLPKEKAAEMAEVATSIAMVDYSRHSRAMLYNRLGMLGDMAATVTTFKHNAYTQLATYGFNKAPKTVFRMALIQLMLAGAVGMYAVDELDDLFNVLRSIAPESMKGVQGPKEALIRNTPEWLAFGGLSAGSRMIVPEGIDIGTKFSMDNLFPDSPIEALFPLFSSLANTAEAVGKAKGAPTFENVAGIAYPMAPAPVKGLMENFIYTDEKGRYVPSKTDQAKTQRSDNEQRIRLSGMRSLDERKESEVAFRTKSNRLRDQELQQKYLDKMRTYARAGDGESVAENAAKYMINGGQWTQVNTFLDKAGRDRVLTEVQRLSPKSFNTVRQQIQQQELQQFQKDVK